MTCHEFEELLGAYALDAVTPAEREAAQEHLAQCQSCTRKYQELRAVVALLPLSVTQVEPSASLKKRVLDAIRQEHSAISQPSASIGRRRRQGWVAQLLAVAAILLLFLFAGTSIWNVSLHTQASSLGQQVSSLQNQIASLKGQVSSMRNQLNNSQGNPTKYVIKGANSSTQGVVGQVIYLPQQNLTILFIRGLPQLQGEQVYQGWLIEGKQPKSIGLLSVQNGIASIDYPGSLTNYAEAAVSLEPGPRASIAPSRVVAVSSLRVA